DSAVSVVQDVLVARLRPVDVIAVYGPCEYEILIVEVDPAQAAAVVQDILAHCTARAIAIRTGLVCYPSAGLTAETLMAKACADVLGAPEESPSVNGRAPVVVENSGMQRLHRLALRVAVGNISV